MKLSLCKRYHPRTNYVLGIEAGEKGKYKQAIIYYQRALENYPAEDKYHHNETLTNLGTAYFHACDFKAAKETWEKALVILPTDKLTLNNLMRCIYNNPTITDELKEISPFIQKFFPKIVH